MKAVCNREALLSACQLVGAAVPSRDIKPVLQNIKVAAKGDRCTLMATDLEIGIRLDVKGLPFEGDGEALLPCAKFLSVLRETRDEQLSIEADEKTCFMRTGFAEFELLSGPVAEFPDVPEFDEAKYHEINAGVLRLMITRTHFAVAKEGGRFSMSGVCWELDGSTVRLIATDGKRLAVAEGVANAVAGEHGKKSVFPVVPAKAMRLLLDVLGDDEEPVRVCLQHNDAFFKTTRATIYSRLVEGRFPDYRVVFPKKQGTPARFSVTPLHAAIRQATIMVDNDSKRLNFTLTKDRLTLEAKGFATGRSKVELPIEYDGKNVTIGFNPQYVTDVLKVLPSDVVFEAAIVDEKTPVLFNAGPEYRYLIMPLT